MQLKQAIIIDEKIGMSTGKMMAQACHASLKAYERASETQQNKWSLKGQKKIILSSGDNELQDLLTRAKHNKLPTYLVKDAGHTELEPGTKTALGIGPAEESKIDKITGELELIK